MNRKTTYIRTSVLKIEFEKWGLKKKILMRDFVILRRWLEVEILCTETKQKLLLPDSFRKAVPSLVEKARLSQALSVCTAEYADGLICPY